MSDHVLNAQCVFEDEINELINIKNKLDEGFSAVIETILHCKGKVVLVGVGKSAHIAKKIEATLNSTGTPAQFLHATEAIHGDLGLLQPNDVCVVISKSGNTEEIKQILPLLKKRSAYLVAITGNTTSELAKIADTVLDISISKEACPNDLAPTSSTTAQLVMGDALAVALIKAKHFSPEDFAFFHPGGALGKKLLLKVEDIIDNKKPQVTIHDSLQKIIISLSSGKHGITPVFDQEKMVGVITDGDLRRALENHQNVLALKAVDLMSTNPKKIDKEALAIEALKKLRQYQVGQLVVVDSSQQYCGILDVHDLLNLGLG